MGANDLASLKALVQDQQSQIKTLHELSTRALEAYVGCRESHANIAQQHRALCECLCAQGLITRRDLFSHMQPRRSARFPGKIRITCKILQFLGGSTARCLCATSLSCIPDLAGHVNAADARAASTGSRPPRTVEPDPQQDGTLPLLRSLFPVQRACVPYKDASSLVLVAPELRQQPQKAVWPSPWPEEQPLGSDIYSELDEILQEPGPPVDTASPAVLEEIWGEAKDHVDSGFYAVFQDLWQYDMMSELFKNAMDAPALQQMRAVSRAGRECMREFRQRVSRGDFTLNTHAGTSEPIRRPPVDLNQTRVVKLCGLRVRTDLNGKIGFVFANRELATNGRSTVLLTTGETLRIRTANVEVLDGPMLTSEQAARRLLAAGHVPRSVVTSSPFWTATAVGMGKLFICGGEGADGSILDSVECFDIARRTWTVGPRLKVPRSDARSVTAGGALYIIGGFNTRRKVLGSMERFDHQTASWKYLPAMDTPRVCCGIGVISGCIYVCGGYTQYPTSTNFVERFNPSTRMWQSLAPMFQERAWAMVATVGRQLYMFGGISNQNPLRSSESFDAVPGEWKMQPEMSQRRCSSATTYAEKCIYIFGGLGPEPLCSAERFRVSSETWESLPPMHQPKVGLSTAVAHRKYIVVCCAASRNAGASIEALNVSDWTWTLLQDPMPAKASLIAESAGRMYICGGSDENGHTSDRMQSLDLETLTCKELPRMPRPRDWSSGAICLVCDRHTSSTSDA